MTTKELIAQVATRTGMTKRMTSELMDNTVSVITDALNNDQVVILQNFGTLSTKERPARKIVHPKTGKEQLSQAKRIVVFKVNNTLKEQTR